MDALGSLKRDILKWGGRALVTRALVTMGVLVTMGCQLTYLAKGAYNQAEILLHREPIENVLKKSDLKDDLRAKLLVAQDVHNFTESKLGLAIGQNYTTYVDLHRPYVVWAVNASPQWALEHHLWWFPIVGDVPYKGFPSESDARNEADELKQQGFDTFMRGVRAYSTLGWFSDPILSSMLSYDEQDLVNTIIHESTHATIYIKSNADFNERLASFVGDKGTELYYAQKEGPASPHLRQIIDEATDQKLFSQFISKEIEELKIFYQTHQTKDFELRKKQFEKIKDHFSENLRPKLKTSMYSQFQKIELNNARLLLYKTYIEDLSDFEKLFNQCQQSMPIFIKTIQKLELSENPVQDLKNLNCL